MPTTRHPVRHPRGRLTPAQEAWLLYGPTCAEDVAFTSAAECRAAWISHRDELMGRHGLGSRVWAWWLFESGGVRFPGLDQKAVLYELGALDAEEKTELLAFWREQFDRSFTPHFFVSTKGQCFRGWRARLKHYEWMDVPRSLLTQWLRERRRNGRRIRELADASGPESVSKGSV